MKVLLISPNRETIPDPVFPLGLSYIAAALKQQGHNVSALDLCFEADMETAIRDRIRAVQPDIIGLSIRNIDDVSYPKSICYLDLYKEVTGLIRKHSKAPLVLGGAGLTIMPGDFMKELDAEYAIVGEGEEAFCDLLKHIQEGISGKERILRSQNHRALRSIDRVPERNLFDAQKYYEAGGMLNIQTKRGCPFRCIYCSYPLIEGKRCRMRAPQAVADELSIVVAKTGVRHFFIVDSIFNFPVDYAEKVCDAMIERNLDINWTCYGTPAHMTGRLAEKMRKAGCTSIEFGTDSMIDETLDVLQKGFHYRQIQDAADFCRAAGIKTCHFLFIGAPGDTVARVKMNLERLEKLGAEVSVLMAGIRVFPRTALAPLAQDELGIDEGLISIRPVYYIAPGVVRELEGIVEYIRENHPKWILPGFEINLNERLQAFLRRTGIKGSLWEEFINR